MLTRVPCSFQDIEAKFWDDWQSNVQVDEALLFCQLRLAIVSAPILMDGPFSVAHRLAFTEQLLKNGQGSRLSFKHQTLYG